MGVTREQAHAIASAHLARNPLPRHRGAFEADRGDRQSTIREVVPGDEVTRAPVPYGLREPLADCWVAYIESDAIAIQSSDIVVITKRTGEIIYCGSANDEG